MKSKYTYAAARVSRRRLRLARRALISAAVLGSCPLHAQTWVPTTAGTYDWGTTGNWNPATVPNSTGAIANVNIDITGAQTINLNANRTVNDLNLGDTGAGTASVITLASGVAGSTLVLGGTNPSLDFVGGSATHAVSAPIQLAANTVFRSNLNAQISLSGVISNDGTVRNMTFNNDVNGTDTPPGSALGQFSLGSANTVGGATGTTSISDVRVSPGVAGAFGANAANTVTITGAGQAYFTGAVTHVNNFVLNGTGWVEGVGNFGSLRIESATLSGTLTMQQATRIGGYNGATGTISGAISGPHPLIKTGPFTTAQNSVIVLSGANTYAGVTTVNDGTLRLASAGALGNSPTVIVENPANPGSSDTNALQLAGGFTYGTGRTVCLRNNSTSNAQNARAVLENQAGNNTWAGNIVLEGGANQALTASAGVMTINGNIINNPANPSTQLFIRGGASGVINGTIDLGSAALVKTDNSTWTIHSTGNTHGNVIVAVATVVLNNTNALQPGRPLLMGQSGTAATRLTINSGFSQSFSSIANANGANATMTIDGAGTIDTGATGISITVVDGTAANDMVITANLTGAGGFTKLGAGNLVLDNLTEGPVTVSQGVLSSSATVGGLTLMPGATLAPGTPSTAGTITTNTLSLTGGTVSVNLGSAGSDLIAVAGANGFTTSGTTTIEVVPNGLAAASTFYPIFSYSGTSPGTSGMTLGALPGRVAGSLTDNGSAIGLTLSNERIVWTGASGPGYAWDTSGALDWKQLSNNTPTGFLAQDDVLFNNDGIANNLISLSGTINPARVQFAHTSGLYTLTSGTLSGSGAMPLLVSGGGSVLLRTNNTFTGPITISNGSLELNRTAGAPQTSGISVAGGATFKWSADNIGDHNLDRALSGAGALIVDANAGGTAGSRSITVNQNNSGFSGTVTVQPTGNLATNGSMRLIVTSQANLGTASVVVAERGQLWVNAGTTIDSPLTLSGYGFQEAAGGVAATAATGADGSSLVVPTGTYAGNSGIGAVRLNGNAVLSGPITISGDTKIMAYNATATISGNLTRTGGSDTFVIGGGGAGSNLWLTGDNSGLGRIWVHGGGAANNTQQLLVGNSTTTGTLGSGDVILYQDAGESRLRIERSDGYTLAAGQRILAAHNGTATNLAKARVVINTPNAGVTLNGGAIDLSDGTNGGVLHVAGVAGGAGINNATLNINSGSTVDVGNFFIGDQSGFAGIVNQTGGTVSAIQMRVGHYGNNTSTYNLNNGSIAITATPAGEPGGGANTEQNGTLYLGVDGTGILNHSGGTINTAAVVLDNRGATAGADQYNLSGSGVLGLRTAYGIVGRNPDAEINLAGGTIRNTGSGVDIAVNSAILTASGTTTLDTNGATNKFSLMGPVTGTGTLTTTGGGLIELEPDSNTTRTSVSTGTGNQTITAVLAGTSAFTKVGTGTTTLTAANTYSGATTVAAGRLNLGGSLASSALTVQNSGALGGKGSAQSITFGASGTDATTLHVDGLTPGAITSTGTLTVNGTVNVSLDGAPTAGDTVTVLHHGGTTATAAQFALLNSSNYRGATFTLGAGHVMLDIDSKNLAWNGTATTTWEIGGSDGDWNTDDEFYQGDRVSFGDLAFASETITMTGALQPASVTFTNTTATEYSLTSAAGNGITGAATISKTGNGTVTLGGDNSFTGGVAVGAGSLRLGAATSFGSVQSITVANEAQVNLNGQTPGNARIHSYTIIGDGPDDRGALINENANIGANAGVVNLTLTGDAVVGAYGGTGDGNRFDIGFNGVTGGTINGNGFTLTKKGNSLINIRGASSDIAFVVAEGVMRAETNNLALGTTGVQVNAGATLDSWADRNFPVPVTLQSGATLTSSSGTATWSGVVTMQGDATFGGGASMIIAQPLAATATGVINKTGGGTLVLPVANTISRKFNVSTGILRIGTDDALGPVPGAPVADAITLQSGGRIQAGTTAGTDLTLDSNRGITLASGDGGFHPWTGFTLNYGGAIAGPGNLTKTDGGTLVFTGASNHTGVTSINAGVANLTGATINSTSVLQVGTATLNIGDGTAITTGRFITSQGSGTVSVVNQTGGTVTITGTNSNNDNTASFLFGHWGSGAASTYNMSGGTLSAVGAELSFGWDAASSIFNQSGGTVNVLGLDLGNSRNNLAIYSLAGGRLNLGSNGITTNANKVANLGGGTLGAYANWNTSQAMILTANGGSLTVDTLDSVDATTARTITMNGALSGPGGLIKTGAGTLSLSGANTYAGATEVNGGRLLVNNTSGSGTGTAAVTVASAGALGGTGTLSGATLINGILQPGNTGVGTLGFGSSLSLSGGATYAVEIAGASSFDRVNVTGTATLNGTIAVTLGYTPVAGAQFQIVNAGTLAGTPSFDFSAAALGSGLSWDTSEFATSGTIKVVAGGDAYAEWAGPGGYNLTGPDAAKNADPDGDGVMNLLEFATNSNPKNPSSRPRVYPLLHTLGGDKALTLTVAVRAGATFAAAGVTQEATRDGVKYTIEGSDNLTGWSTVVISKLGVADSAAVQAAITPPLPALEAGWQWHSFRTDGGVSTDTEDFIRLKVTEAP